MSPVAEDRKKEAFDLFEQGRYADAYAICTTLLEGEKDPSIAVLRATILLSMGHLDEAEAHFRDLAEKMPDSSYVHSYLGAVLDQKGDEGAVAEYARAVLLDPTNADALRRYSRYLMASGDYAAALAPLRQLVALQGKEEELLHLMRALTKTGRADEAIYLHDTRFGERGFGIEYLDALAACGRHQKASEIAFRAYQATKAPVFLRRHLASRARFDPAGVRAEYESALATNQDPDIAMDYCHFLQGRAEFEEALALARAIIISSGTGEARLMQCELLSALSRKDEALECYEQLITAELKSMDDLDTLARVIPRYREFLQMYYPMKEMVPRFVSLVSSHANVVCLLATARFYEDLGDPLEARSWYYRAYRSDFLPGGVAYAEFLSRHDDLRECEKVMIYILNNIRKTTDLLRVARVMVEDQKMRYQLKRFLGKLLEKLQERIPTLGSQGLELLAVAFLLAGTDAIERKDYVRGKEYCLRGLDVLPPSSCYVRPKDFLGLIETCKDHSLADRPILAGTGSSGTAVTAPSPPITVLLDLDERERTILGFLQMHRRASEMELRKITGTRRVVGMVNRLMQKASAKGLKIIEKKGWGEDGEIYEYSGP
jgi:tetratricopeptide (TPR) repeat protein